MKEKFKRSFLIIGIVGSASLLGGCAGQVKGDPFEGYNRAMFKVNDVVDRAAIKPVAEVYSETPEFLRMGIGNFFSNLKEPANIVNNMLQGRGDAGIKSFTRLFLNSTVGILGLIDVASMAGIEKNPSTFGDTMKTWGVPAGPFLILPILGPTTTRDAAGLPVDFAMDPVAKHSPISERNASIGVRGIDDRATVLPAERLVEDAALDKYSFIRSAVMQKRGGAQDSDEDEVDARSSSDEAASKAAPKSK